MSIGKICIKTKYDEFNFITELIGEKLRLEA